MRKNNPFGVSPIESKLFTDYAAKLANSFFSPHEEEIQKKVKLRVYFLHLFQSNLTMLWEVSFSLCSEKINTAWQICICQQM